VLEGALGGCDGGKSEKCGSVREEEGDVSKGR